MLKKVKLFIKSHIDNLDSAGLPEGDTEVSELSVLGTMKINGDGISLSYNENTESGELHSYILADEGRVTVMRNGAIVSTLRFSEGEVYNTVYELPPYKFDISVTTKKIRNTLTESGGALDIIYEMNVGGAAKRTKMKITVSEV
ncbi:MAG: DUF1934 domain-containing protein [Clostridia bacterium]|nr:DUF1934 domain-containing protein [Clostridia bacterium]